MASLTVNQLEAADSSAIWVHNTTSESTGGRGIVCLLPKIDGGEPTAVTVPVTWIPINLTEQVPKADLLKSPDFRNTVRQGRLRIIDDAEAAEAQEQDGYAEEYAAVRGMTMQTMNQRLENPAAAEDVAATLSSPVLGLIERMGSLETQIQVVNQIRNIGNLSLAEYRALRTKARELNLSEVRAFITKEVVRLYPDTKDTKE